MGKEFEEIHNEICKAPLRSSVITFVAVLENMLEQLIVKHLIEDAAKLDLFEGSGCLSTFSSKCKLAYSMGLISKELYQDLDSLRKIRNNCAHQLSMDEDIIKSIRDRIKNFKLLHAVAKVGEDENIKVCLVLEYAIILLALKKRINNVQTMEVFPFEVHDDYLAYDEHDSDIGEMFEKLVKKRK